MIHWKKTSEELPECGKLLWLKEASEVYLGERFMAGNLWCWAIQVGFLTIEGGNIVSDCETGDFNPDEWAYVN